MQNMTKRYLLLISILCAYSAHAQLPPPDSIHTPYNITFTGFAGDTASALDGLRSELAEILPNTKYRRMTPSLEIVFYNPDNSLHPIYAVNPTLPVLPASVEKLFTRSPSHIFRVTLSPKETIILTFYVTNAKGKY